jgi:hypothetical protein
MKKLLYIIFVLWVFSLLQAPPAAAWNDKTHYDIAEQTYYSLPVSVQHNLNLATMEDGADDPDLKFFDFNYHHYPASRDKVDYWLDEGKYCYKMGEYKQASYCFGVASHYISDSDCAPHCAGSSVYYHTIYELRAIFLNSHVTPSNGYSDSILASDNLEGKVLWNNWMKNQDNKQIQRNLDQAATASYSGINSCLA